MKLGMIGAGGTGKTTTLDLLNTSLPKIRSVMRETFQEFGWTELTLKGVDPSEVWRFQKTCFDKKIVQDQSFTEGIAERTLLDHLMYCYYYCCHQMDDNVARAMEALTLENMGKYDLLIYFPVGVFKPADDGLRQNGFAYQLLQDAIIRGLLNRMQLRYVTVGHHSVDERVQSINYVIQHGTYNSRQGDYLRL